MIKNKEKIKHFILYVFFGILTTIVSFGSFYIFRKIFIYTNENILNTLSIVIAIIFSYFVNRIVIFKSKEKNMLNEFLRFLSGRSFSAIFEIISFFILNTILKINGMLSKSLISVFVIILNYIISKKFVFNKKKTSL